MEVDPGGWMHYERWIADALKTLNNRDKVSYEKGQPTRMVWWRVPGFDEAAAVNTANYMERWKWAFLEYYVHAMAGSATSPEITRQQRMQLDIKLRWEILAPSSVPILFAFPDGDFSRPDNIRMVLWDD